MKISLCGMGAMGKLVLDIADKQGIKVLSAIDDMTHSAKGKVFLGSDVIIDFSHPDNLTDLLNFALSEHTPLVLATTGYSKIQRQKIFEASQHIPILQAYNMSYSMSIMAKTLEYMMSLIDDRFDIEIVEMHHNKKIDAPSGTAKMLYEIIGQSKDSTLCYDYTQQSGRSKQQVGIHALRGGTVFGEHEIIFAGEDEIISLKHRALSKRIFANGALKGAHLLLSKKTGLYGLKDLF